MFLRLLLLLVISFCSGNAVFKTMHLLLSAHDAPSATTAVALTIIHPDHAFWRTPHTSAPDNSQPTPPINGHPLGPLKFTARYALFRKFFLTHLLILFFMHFFRSASCSHHLLPVTVTSMVLKALIRLGFASEDIDRGIKSTMKTYRQYACSWH